MPVNDTHQVGMGFKQVSVLLLSISLLLLLSFIIYGSVLGWESLDAGISAGLWVPMLLGVGFGVVLWSRGSQLAGKTLLPPIAVPSTLGIQQNLLASEPEAQLKAVKQAHAATGRAIVEEFQGAEEELTEVRKVVSTLANDIRETDQVVAEQGIEIQGIVNKVTGLEGAVGSLEERSKGLQGSVGSLQQKVAVVGGEATAALEKATAARKEVTAVRKEATAALEKATAAKKAELELRLSLEMMARNYAVYMACSLRSGLSDAEVLSGVGIVLSDLIKENEEVYDKFTRVEDGPRQMIAWLLWLCEDKDLAVEGELIYFLKQKNKYSLTEGEMLLLKKDLRLIREHAASVDLSDMKGYFCSLDSDEKTLEGKLRLWACYTLNKRNPLLIKRFFAERYRLACEQGGSNNNDDLMPRGAELGEDNCSGFSNAS